jgi:hypothetical protein
LGYAQRHREAQRQYRKTGHGKKKHCEAERRRRLQAPAGKKSIDKEKRINKQPIPAKQHNPDTTTALNKIKRDKTTGPDRPGKGKYSKKQLKKGIEGACIICGEVGDIVKKISCNREKPQHFSFRVRRWMINRNNGKPEKKKFPVWFLR